MSGPRITFPTCYNPLDPSAFGGRMAMAVPALREAGLGLELLPLGPSLALARAWARRRLARMRGQQYNVYRDPAVIRQHARQIQRHVQRKPCRLILSPMSPGSQPIAFVNTGPPRMIWTDSTLAGWLEEHDYRPSGAIEARNLRDGLANERQAMHDCRFALFWSDWAANAAIRHYGLASDRVGVLPSGPSVQAPSGLEAEQLAGMRGERVCKLVFIGVNFRRKGGDIALEVVRILQSRGIDARLTLIGAEPPDAVHPLPPKVDRLGYLCKDKPQDAARMQRALLEAHFLLLPSRNDCTPLVVNDACAHGLPCIARDIGGMRTLVRERINGQLIAPEAGAQAYAEGIAGYFGDAPAYRELVRSTLEDFHHRLSWPAVARSMTRLIEQTLNDDRDENETCVSRR